MGRTKTRWLGSKTLVLQPVTVWIAQRLLDVEKAIRAHSWTMLVFSKKHQKLTKKSFLHVMLMMSLEFWTAKDNLLRWKRNRVKDTPGVGRLSLTREITKFRSLFSDNIATFCFSYGRRIFLYGRTIQLSPDKFDECSQLCYIVFRLPMQKCFFLLCTWKVNFAQAQPHNGLERLKKPRKTPHPGFSPGYEYCMAMNTTVGVMEMHWKNWPALYICLSTEVLGFEALSLRSGTYQKYQRSPIPPAFLLLDSRV